VRRSPPWRPSGVSDQGSSEAVAAYWKPFHVGYLTWVFAEFGRPPGSLPATHSELRTPEAQAVCGNARDVAAEVRRRLALMGGADRLLIQFDHGGLPYDEVSAAMQRFAEQVRPDLDVGVAATT